MATEATFGNWLRQQRRQLDWTQAALAQRVGYSVATIRKLERDELRPSKQLAELLTQVLEVAVTDHARLVSFARSTPTSPLQPDAPPLDEPRRSNLPAQLTPFFGRTAEIVELTQHLNNPAARLITIVGPGGMGKTRLAQEVAKLILDLHNPTDTPGNPKSKIVNPKFPDGVYFVALAPLRVPEHIVPAIAEAIMLRFQAGNRPPKQQLLDYLRHKELLLVLDNFEHLAAGSELILVLLHECPALRLLVTAREHLQLHSETLLLLDSMALPATATLPDVLSYSAIQLFVETACRLRPAFTPTPANAAAILQICQLVGGMPLGIILAATWVEVLSPDEIVAELSQSFDFLAAELGDLPERQRSMRAIFDHSWKLLSQPARQVMCQLSIFCGSFTREAAATVADAALPILAELMTKSLLRRNQQGYYDLHELVRQYAALQLAQDGALAAKTAEKHSHYYLHWLVQQDQGLKGARQAETLAEINRAIDNLRLAWRWAIMQRSSATLDPVIPVFWLYYEYRRLFNEPIAMLQEAAACFQSEVDRNEASLITFAHLVGTLGYFHLRVGNLSAARSEITHSLTLLRPFPSTSAFASVLLQGGIIFHTIGEFERGFALLQEALAIHRQRQDSWNMAVCYFYLGNAKLTQNEFGESMDYLTQCLQHVRALGERFAQASALAFLAAATLGGGQPTEARQIAEEALLFARQTGDRWLIAQGLNVLGLVAHGEQNYHDARRLLEESAAICEQLGEAWSLSRVTFNLGKTLLSAGEEQAARRVLRHSLQVAHAAQFLPDVLNVLITLVGEATSTTPNSDRYRWAVLVAQHPASPAEARAQAEGLCRTLELSLAPQTLQTLRDPLQANTLDEIVTELLTQVTETDSSQ